MATPSMRSMGREVREPKRAKFATAREASLIPRSGIQKHSLQMEPEFQMGLPSIGNGAIALGVPEAHESGLRKIARSRGSTLRGPFAVGVSS
jgi:hypothetical protein